MLRVTKIWLALLVLALPLAWVAPAGAAPLLGTKGAGDDADKWLLDNADFVFVLNFKQLVASDIMKKGGADSIRGAIKNNEQAKAIFDATGIDPLKDVDSLLVSGTLGAKASDSKGLVVVRGRFDPAKLVAAAKKKEDAKVTREGDIDLIQLKVQDNQNAYAAVLNKNTVVITQSKESTVDWAKNGGKKSARMSKNLKSALGGFTGKETLTFAMVVGEDLKKLIAKVPQLAQSGSKLQSLTAGLTITDAAALKVVGYTGDAKSAGQLKKTVVGLKGVAELLAQSDENFGPLVGDILGAVKISNDNKSVQIDLKVTKDMIEKAGKGGSDK